MADAENFPVATIPKNKGSEVRISLSNFQGQQLVDLRTFLSVDDSGVLRATRKGVSLSFGKLSDLLAALALADERGREMGWTGGAK